MPLTPEQEEAIRQIREERAHFRTTVGRDPYVLASILDDRCYWSQDAKLILPDSIAFCNRLLGRMGIVVPGSGLRLAQALISCATEDDLNMVKGEG